MNTWFLLTVAAAFFAGLHAFAFKIVAARNIDIVVVTVYTSLASGFILLCVTAFFFGFHGYSNLLLGLALLEGILYFIANVIRNSALKVVDTVIYYPIYKLVGPIFGIALGLVIFSERFTSTEWIGLALSLFVPLMLISRHEHIRQNNLIKGLYLIVITAFLAAINAMITKFGATLTSNAIVFALLVDGVIILSGLMALYAKERGGLFVRIKNKTNSFVLRLSIGLGIFNAAAFGFFIFAFAAGGPLGIVYAIHSLYIVIPIILSVIFYNEHLNTRKAIAVVLSIVALGLLM